MFLICFPRFLHVARIVFCPTSRENGPFSACRAENNLLEPRARCASSTHSPCPRRTPARAAPHWSLPATSTRGGSAMSGSTPMRPPGVHLAHSGRWLLPVARMLRRRPFFLASSTPSTHRTTHVAQLRTQKLQRRESKSGTWQVKTDLQGTTQLMLNMKLVFDDRLACFRNPACRL